MPKTPSVVVTPSKPTGKLCCECGKGRPQVNPDRWYCWDCRAPICEKCGGQHRKRFDIGMRTVCSSCITKPVVEAPKTLASMLTANRNTFTGSGVAPHLIVEARAGTGKTTTLISAIQILKGIDPGIKPSPQQQAVWDVVGMSQNQCRTVCFVAFNVSIAGELKKRVPPGVDAKTLHGMGYGAVRKQFTLIEGHEINKKRVLNIIAEIMKMDIRELRREKPVFTKAVQDVVDKCKMNLIDPDQPGWTTTLMDLARHYEIEMTKCETEVGDVVPQVLERCLDVDRDKCVDHCDQIWLPVVHRLPMFKFDVLFVDEAQDLNRCQQAMIKMAGRRLILCGDPKQAIYGFAGADAKSMDRMFEELSRCETSPEQVTSDDKFHKAQYSAGCMKLPLTVTRRCGKAIVKEANYYVKEFEAHETNCDGTVKQMAYPLQPGKEWGTVRKIPIEKSYLPHVEPLDMVICRTVAPLVAQYFQFLKMGKRAVIQGRDIADGLISLITSFKCHTVVELIAALDLWRTSETEKENAKEYPSELYLANLQDKYDCIAAFMEGKDRVEQIINQIESVFKSNDEDESGPPPIRMSSIHKAKGLESRRVFFLRPAVCPSRPTHKMLPWQFEQEQNLQYVAITRAIEELVYVT